MLYKNNPIFFFLAPYGTSISRHMPPNMGRQHGFMMDPHAGKLKVNIYSVLDKPWHTFKNIAINGTLYFTFPPRDGKFSMIFSLVNREDSHHFSTLRKKNSNYFFFSHGKISSTFLPRDREFLITFLLKGSFFIECTMQGLSMSVLVFSMS